MYDIRINLLRNKSNFFKLSIYFILMGTDKILIMAFSISYLSMDLATRNRIWEYFVWNLCQKVYLWVPNWYIWYWKNLLNTVLKKGIYNRCTNFLILSAFFFILRFIKLPDSWNHKMRSNYFIRHAIIKHKLKTKDQKITGQRFCLKKLCM